MSKLWLPVTNKYKRVYDEVTDRSMIIVIPYVPDSDAVQMHDIEQAAIDRTIEQLRAMGPREKGKLSKKEVAGALREYNEYRHKKAEDIGHKEVH